MSHMTFYPFCSAVFSEDTGFLSLLVIFVANTNLRRLYIPKILLIKTDIFRSGRRNKFGSFAWESFFYFGDLKFSEDLKKIESYFSGKYWHLMLFTDPFPLT